jgi:hypothetical protein
MLGLTKRIDSKVSAGDDETASDNSGHVKIGAEAALAGINYGFEKSGITKDCIASLENLAHYFLKGYGRAPGDKSVLDPHENEAVLFKDSLLLVSVCLRTQSFWIFCATSGYSCIS